MSDEDVLAGLFEQLDLSEPEDVDDLSKLSLTQLSDLLVGYDARLKELGEILAGPTGGTPEAREIHSRRGAVVVEMRKRGW